MSFRPWDQANGSVSKMSIHYHEDLNLILSSYFFKKSKNGLLIPELGDRQWGCPCQPVYRLSSEPQVIVSDPVLKNKVESS